MHNEGSKHPPRRRSHSNARQAENSQRRFSPRPPRSSSADLNEPLEFTIESDMNVVTSVQKPILERIAQHKFSGQATFAIRVALEEVLINAIRHGNKFDKSKKVHVVAKITPQRAEITVEDEGPGFERVTVPDPTLEENLTKCSGRGILLMEAYMTKVEWSRGGRRVKLVRDNNDNEPSPE